MRFVPRGLGGGSSSESSSAQPSKARRPTQEWIAELAGGRSFVDVGGLWGIVNERVSDAALAGATSLTMVDKQPSGRQLWQSFRDRMEELSIDNVRCVVADVTTPEAIETIGRHDVVHCSGIIYHLPDPVGLLRQLHALSNEYVMVVGMVIPDRIETEAGTLDLGGGAALFVPGLDERQLRIVRAYCEEVGMKPRTLTEWESQVWMDAEGKPLGPWWWLFTPSVLRRMIEVCGFELLADTPQSGRSHAFLCRVIR